MSAVTKRTQRHYTLEEYLALERYSNVRHEYLDGEIFAMAGGTREHGAIAANVIGALTAHLRGRPCQVHTSDVRIRVAATGLVTYPDVSIVCGSAEVDRTDRDALLNPVFLVEVTSPSTAEYDRGEKLEHYQRIATLREIVFVSHEEQRLDLVRRGADGGWLRLAAGPGETLQLESLDCELHVDEVYRNPLL